MWQPCCQVWWSQLVADESAWFGQGWNSPSHTILSSYLSPWGSLFIWEQPLTQSLVNLIYFPNFYFLLQFAFFCQQWPNFVTMYFFLPTTKCKYFFFYFQKIMSGTMLWRGWQKQGNSFRTLCLKVCSIICTNRGSKKAVWCKKLKEKLAKNERVIP